MLGKLNQLKWTANAGNSRDLAFIILILAFGIILVVKLAPYYQKGDQSVVYNKVQTSPALPKSLLEQLALPFSGGHLQANSVSARSAGSGSSKVDANRPSVLERPLFDGQTVLLQVRSLNNYTTTDSNQPIEVHVVRPAGRTNGEVDLSPAIDAKLVGAASPNLPAKRLYINFNELVAADGRTYPVQGQAVSSEALSSGIEGDYSSGLPSRLLGIALDRTIMAADQIGTAYLFSAIGPSGLGAQELRNAAMETNQQASQNVSAAATQDLRETPAEIKIPSGTQFYVRIRGSQTGGRQ